MFKKNKQGTHRNKLVMVVYAFAIIMLLAFILSFYDVTVYILSLHASGAISFSVNWFDCIIYYMSNTLNYLGFSVVIFCLGYCMSHIKNICHNEHSEDESSSNEQQ